MAKLSVIIPFFNEEANLRQIHGELSAVAASELKNYELEVILMDNHSTDRSFAVASEIATEDSRCRVLRLSRNFGYQANILAGFMACSGDAAIQLDADGEDDPMLIPALVENWEKGIQVVYGIRRSRVEGWFLTFQRKIYYRMLNSISSVPIPPDAGDFRLIDRKVIEALRHFKEANPYLRGLIAYAGFNQVGIVYDRRPRYAGESKFSWWDYLSLAWVAITSFSAKPLLLAMVAGVGFAGLSFVGAIVYLALYLSGDIEVRGFTTLVLIQLFIASIQLLCLGLIGKYIGSIFEEVKRRPRGIVEKSFPKDQAHFNNGIVD